MLKVFVSGIAIILTSLIIQSCKEEDDRPSVNFVSTSLQTSELDGYANLEFLLDQRASEDVTLALEFSGSGIRGKDYNCSNQVTIPKGQKAGDLRLEILDDGEYELSEEAIIVTITDAGNNLRIGKKNTATTVIALDKAPRLTVSLSWNDATCTEAVDMDLGLFRSKVRGVWERSSLTAISKDSGTEEVIIPALETSGFFGLAYRYTSGDCKELTFTVTMKCYNCTINGKNEALTFKGRYTNINLNPTNNVQVIQAFEQKDLNFFNFSGIEIPEWGSRTESH